MSATPLAPIAAPIHLQFEDNRLLPQLFGQHDQNLARIEQELGVSMVPRGNQLAISGPTDAVATAKQVVTGLYQRLKRGLEVDAGEVDAALRMTREDDRLEPNLFEGGNGKDGMAIRTARRHITPRSAMQAKYMRMLHEHELVFGLGPAGTGKTYLAVAVAVAMLTKGAVDRIILSRPAVEAGEKLGFLPGDMREKVDPYLRPLYDALNDMLPGDQVVKRMTSGEIEVAPLAFMRGRTLAHSFVILDEAQNTTPMQMKMFLTRLGQGSRMAITGDLSQIDLPSGTKSGLKDALEAVEGIDGLSVARFSEVDVVRHPLVARIVGAYDARDRKAAGKG
ncbi:PhoH family protein [Dongia rigui]|uniref:PhoH-like protein n=1 Tax=Dongia rigui TaxID=940149 RepID=A0ABU5DWU5_9PROT|nr:PhoH family protein [Dongia rigui]MDY0871787.1 PhoH family protein [Dongia rigui]